ncbi:hypothetical protein B0H13DRAFT_2272483 [Mycena leptocephala]|nr:hypothetical protein B0H13DRAFT_2272483 [Mycena leptocephala]
MYAKTQTGKVSIFALPAFKFPKLASPVQAVLVAQGIGIGGQRWNAVLCQMPCHAFERTFPSYGAIVHDESGRHPRMRRGRLVTLRFLHSHSSYRGNRENRQKSLVSSAWMYCK